MILNKCLFGSRLYGSHSEKSDHDYIVIQDELEKIEDVNIHCFTKESFITAVKNGDIACLEVYFADKSTFEVYKWEFPTVDINKESFRRNISMLTSNSWVKGKKKLIVIGDYDLDIALKSIFHSIRILDFAIQIMREGKILDYSNMNWLLRDLYKLSAYHDRQELWDKINDKYRTLFNSKATEFKKLNPIEKQTEKLRSIKEILEKHNCFNTDLLEELKLLI